jgi:uncharacterized membrane-anchored protein YhcB (DUF1043 family)
MVAILLIIGICVVGFVLYKVFKPKVDSEVKTVETKVVNKVNEVKQEVNTDVATAENVVNTVKADVAAVETKTENVEKTVESAANDIKEELK